jgi:hypothetical protein
MSDIVFNQYLLYKSQESKNTMNYNNDNNKVAVIVEPRKHNMLQSVIKNVATFLDKTWNLHIFTFDIKWCADLFPEWNIKFTKLSHDNLSTLQYSHLLMNKEFWNSISEEHILIFQTDCIFFRKGFDNFLEYDYIGPNYYNPKHLTPNGIGIQGGVSLRKKSAMLDCIDKINYDIINNYRKEKRCDILNDDIEDVFFTHACQILNKNVATNYINKTFGIEVPFDFYNKTLCHHGANKPYFTVAQSLELLSNS